jgi:hypothetical protein
VALVFREGCDARISGDAIDLEAELEGAVEERHVKVRVRVRDDV